MSSNIQKMQEESNIIMGWINFLVEREYVAKSKFSVYVWTVKGADYLATRIHSPGGDYSVYRDPTLTTPLCYCRELAKVIDVETAKVLGGFKDESTN